MSTKSEIKKISADIKAEINQDFNLAAVQTITDIFLLEKKTIPIFSKISNNQIRKIYVKTINNLNKELMWHRNKPIETEKLCKLYQIAHLPKSTKIILKSFI